MDSEYETQHVKKNYAKRKKFKKYLIGNPEEKEQRYAENKEDKERFCESLIAEFVTVRESKAEV
jgi:hypothetical protein